MSTPMQRGPVRAHSRLDKVMKSASQQRHLKRSGYTPMFDGDLRGIVEMFENDYSSCRAGCVDGCDVTGRDDPKGLHDPVMQMVQAMRITTMLLLMYQPIPGGRQTISQLAIEDIVPVPSGLNLLIPERIGAGGKRLGQRVIIDRNIVDKALCPVSSLLAWIELLAEEGITEGPVFRAVNRHRNTYMKGTEDNPVRDGENITLSDSGLELIVKGTCEKAVERGYLRPGKWGVVSLLLGASVRAVHQGDEIAQVARVLNFSPDTVVEVVDLCNRAA